MTAVKWIDCIVGYLRLAKVIGEKDAVHHAVHHARPTRACQKRALPVLASVRPSSPSFIDGGLATGRNWGAHL